MTTKVPATTIAPGGYPRAAQARTIAQTSTAIAAALSSHMPSMYEPVSATSTVAQSAWKGKSTFGAW